MSVRNGSPPLEVKVWGEFACFTRPEMKVERVSYPVMTPSAARGILEAIFWKPEFAWRIREIHVLKPIRHFSILRNEINSRQSDRASAARGGHYFVEEDRAQRHTLGLRNVEYVIKADVALRPHATVPEPAYRDQFRRRVKRGQCRSQPVLGCREFPAWFGEPHAHESAIAVSDDLGLMLFDLKYRHNKQGLGIGAQPVFFEARLENGVLHVPAEKYKEVA
ncbi:MAG TPA: type I-C CRISPR-associated protein Cas5 [Candidatus Hydrogenedentes bacterium]|nr:type I-C CRISPR-associated protein Cas5 [Candidatus Hydrogenedentota bacterium]